MKPIWSTKQTTALDDAPAPEARLATSIRGERPAQSIDPGRRSPAAKLPAGELETRALVETFIGEVRQLWSRQRPGTEDLWQPPGE